MAGTIITDRIESDASYASSITVASPLVVSNTISLGSAAAITGNLNIDNGTLFVDSVNNRIGVGTQNPSANLDVVHAGNTAYHFSTYIDQFTSASFGIRSAGDGFSTVLFNYGSRGTGNFWKIDVANGLFGVSRFLAGTNTHTNAIGIDGAGFVTKPYQPAFLASNTTLSYTGTTNTSPFAFNNTTLNIGSGFNTSTFRFTAPIAGRYLLYYSFFYDVGEGISNCDTSFYVNGTQLSGGTAISLASRPNQDRITVGNTLVLNLNASDFVDVRGRDATGTGNAIYGPHSYFGGYLVG